MRGDGEPEVLVAAPCPAWDEPTPTIHRIETHGNKSHFVPKLVVLGFHPGFLRNVFKDSVRVWLEWMEGKRSKLG